MSDDDFDPFEGDDDFDEDDELIGGPGLPLDASETRLIEQDLFDLDQFEAAFQMEGYKGVAVYCQDCAEDHFYPWDMLRENLNVLLETGETPVHEPAFAPDPEEYIPWEYARGYVDALREIGVEARRPVGVCQCGFRLPEELVLANFCPRCGSPLLATRLADALRDHGMSDAEISDVLREMGIPG